MNGVEEKQNKPKRDVFRWFVAVLVFILLLVFINKTTEKPKSTFDSCYEKCTSLGRAPKEDGTCEDNYHKVNNWCKSDGWEAECLNTCMK